MCHKNELRKDFRNRNNDFNVKFFKERYMEKKADILFIIDATGSMAGTIRSAHQKAKDIALDFTNNYPDTNFRFGAICYRDPVDCSNDKHEFCQLNSDINLLVDFLGGITATGGGDGPEDFAGAFEIAFHKIIWRNGPKNIVHIADAPAHGKRFCETENHEDQTQPLVNLVQEMSMMGFFYCAIPIGTYPVHGFNEMKNIYEQYDGPSFTISPFTEASYSSIPFEQAMGKKIQSSSWEILKASYQHYYGEDLDDLCCC